MTGLLLYPYGFKEGCQRQGGTQPLWSRTLFKLDLQLRAVPVRVRVKGRKWVRLGFREQLGATTYPDLTGTNDGPTPRRRQIVGTLTGTSRESSVLRVFLSQVNFDGVFATLLPEGGEHLSGRPTSEINVYMFTPSSPFPPTYLRFDESSLGSHRGATGASVNFGRWGTWNLCPVPFHFRGGTPNTLL